MNQNSVHAKTEARVLFVDMDSFFARCEQQVNFWLRNRPVGVCVYTGKYGCVISLSKEAKALGIKAGTRLNEVMEMCPEFVPVESNPTRYREFHVKIITILQRYCQDVIPKSIDEAIINLSDYKLLHPDPEALARQIKGDILREVGDWLTCSIGIAPNAFLAKLGSVIGKKNTGNAAGLQLIDPANIDSVLSKLKLGDLPGIGRQMSTRLERAGITTPLEMRYAEPHKLKAIFKSIEGNYWHYRLNFIETNIVAHEYKGMQAMRQVSKEKRISATYMEQLFLTLCCTLEKRMVRHKFYCKAVGFSCHYVDGSRWEDGFTMSTPMQDAITMMNMVKTRIAKFEEIHQCAPIFNNQISSLRLSVTNFVNNGNMLYSLFEDEDKKETARQTMHAIKNQFGHNKIMRAVELTDNKVIKDVIGFGSVKDLTDLDYAAIPRYE